MAAYVAAMQNIRKYVEIIRRDPFELPDDLLIAEYRLNKKLIVELCDMLRPKLARSTNQSKALTSNMEKCLQHEKDFIPSFSVSLNRNREMKNKAMTQKIKK